MAFIPQLPHPNLTLKRKLFGYMLVLVLLILAVLMAGLSLSGRYGSTERETLSLLQIHLDMFTRDVSRHMDQLAASAVRLSEDITVRVEQYLTGQGITLEELNDSEEHIAALQGQLIHPLRQDLHREDCSGVFLMLDATVNTALPGAESSRTGLYLQINGYKSSSGSEDVLLYRGLSEVARSNGIMPHRKWHLEFDTSLFPNYRKLCRLAPQPLARAFLITEPVTLPETGDRVMLLALPVMASDGSLMGICGYEISESFFMTYHAQNSRTDHLTYLLSPTATRTVDSARALSCGVANGYYRVPTGRLSFHGDANGLLTVTGDAVDYVAAATTVSLSPNNDPFQAAVLFLKSSYQNTFRDRILRDAILWAALLAVIVYGCQYFSRRFLSPVLRDLERLKNQDSSAQPSRIHEMNDLFAYLEQKDRLLEEQLQALIAEKEAAQSEKERLQAEYRSAQQKYETAQAEIARLAYSRKQEVDPADYSRFLEGIGTLTPTERKVFDYYLEGKTVREITEIASIKESTLRYHNQNIYGKLGVNSLKQLLRYAALMNRQDP